jgi:hypothetical protein
MEITNMAQLSSPGVSVTVIDESFYTPAAPGTTPLIIIASEESKQNGSSTGTAPGTLAANAGKVYLLTSQKDLADTFGTPVFKTDANNNPIHAGEQNEYGLQAAYSYLGVSNRAFVVRADIDLASLDAQATAPAGAPADGSFWFDTSNTSFGIFEWNSASIGNGGQVFTVRYPTIITNANQLISGNVENAPLSSLGAIGDYAIVSTTALHRLYYKKALTNTAAGTWVKVGSPEWYASWPIVQSGTVTTLSSSLFINGEEITGVTTLAGLVTAINSYPGGIAGVTAAAVNNKLELYSNGTSKSDGTNIDGAIYLEGGMLPDLGLAETTYLGTELAIQKQTGTTPVTTFSRTANADTANGVATGAVWVKTSSSNLGADWIIKKYSAATGAWVEQSVALYPNGHSALAELDQTGGGLNLALGRLYVKYNDDQGTPSEADFKIYARNAVGPTSIRSIKIVNNTFTPGTNTFTIAESLVGSTSLSSAVSVSFTAGSDAVANIQALVGALTGAAFVNITAVINSDNSITISHTKGGDFVLDDGLNTPLSKIYSVGTTANLYADPASGAGIYLASLWTATVGGSAFATASTDAPTTIPADGTLWYNSIIDEVDILINNGSAWVGYQYDGNTGISNDAAPYYDNGLDPNGPIVSATRPTSQSDGTALAAGDLWISTADLENFPLIYMWNGDFLRWDLIDNSDQTSENGILFNDARWSVDGLTAEPSSIVDLLGSDFVDPDAPDPALYPRGMLLWNLRRSGFNVKRFVQNSIDVLARNPRYGAGEGEQMDDYYPHRWLSEAGNQENGAGTFGRKAQRKVVVQALQALVNANQEIRDEESRVFNLIATPGYPELVGEMVALNYDRGLTAFVVGDTPARLTPDATTLNNWGTNQAGALEDNDTGLVSSDEYLGFFYPWGYTSDNIGNNIVVPPSHMMLRTIALSDNVSYPWFAPAGTRRGGITNATAVGYVDSVEGEFKSVALNNGQRDTLAGIKVNPLTFITGTGLVNYGQFTRARNASSLDRINVARLVIYLRRQFAQLAKPYVFEPNDKITRDEIKQAAESLLLELVGQRALYDYLVVCDTSNNTPSRIDRNELYLDVAIEPVKSVEFIYIPLRLKNTGEIAGLSA